MPTRDLASNISVVPTINAATLTADTNGAAVDSSGFESVTHIVNVGESGDTLSGSVYWEFVLQDSADGSTWADVTDNDLITGEGVTVDANGVFATIDAPAEDDVSLKIGYIGDKRYTRVQVDATGSHSSGTPISASAIKGHPHVAPAS